jgi:hypothetical protein
VAIVIGEAILKFPRKTFVQEDFHSVG